MENHFLLYIDILGFAQMVKDRPDQVDEMYKIIASLNVHRHSSFRFIIFSDTVLVYNLAEPANRHDRVYLIMYLCEFVQDLLHRLAGRDIFFRAVLLEGSFQCYVLNQTQCYYGSALIDAYGDEKKIKCPGLFISNSLIPDCRIFETVPYDEKYS